MADKQQSILAGVVIESEKVQIAMDNLRVSALMPIGQAFAKNIVRMKNLVTTPFENARSMFSGSWIALTVVDRLTKHESGNLMMEVELARRGLPVSNQKYLEQIHDEIRRTFEERVTSSIYKAVTGTGFILEILAFREEQDEVYRDWVYSQLAAAASAAWTAFECVATELWVSTLNSHPMAFWNRVMKHVSSGIAQDGLSGKQLSLGVLAKYHFNIENHLGTLLKPKFDLTSLANIRDAFSALFGKREELESIFAEQDFHLLEACRHVIVHRAGVVDAEFMARTKNMGETFAEGLPLPLSGTLLSRMLNAGITAGCRLLCVVDDQIATLKS